MLSPPSGPRVELGHPGADPVGVELIVPRPVQRVGEVDALAVAADLDHLRSARERHVGRAGCGVRLTMPPSRTDPTWVGCAGSETSNCFISPVPQQET